MSQLAIVTTIFSSKYNSYFEYNWDKFLQFIDTHHLSKHLYICEVLGSLDKSLIVWPKKRYIALNNNSTLWHKESAANYIISKLPDIYNSVLLIDNDIIFNKPQWYDQTKELLKEYNIVQPFDKIDYLCPDNETVELSDKGVCKYAESHNNIINGNPGIAIAYNRDYLIQAGGLFNRCIVGGGDMVNIIPPFYDTHATSMKIFDSVCVDSHIDLVNYLNKARTIISNSSLKPATYLSDNTAKHLFHGYWSHRQYGNRYNLIKNLCLKNIASLDANSLYELHDYITIDNIKKFFTDRISKIDDEAARIIVSSKYKADSPNVLWLNPNTNIIFHNMLNVSIKINKSHDLNNIKIYANHKDLDITSLIQDNNMCIDIKNPKILEISSNNISKIPGDLRNLGLYISDIKYTDMSNNSKQYSLYDIL